MSSITVRHVRNVFDTADRAVSRHDAGRAIGDYAPAGAGRLLCYYNGAPILMEDWECATCPGDQLTFVTLPAGPLLPYIWYIVYAVTLVAALSLRPDVPRAQKTSQESPSYNVALSSNQARLGQAIPVLYGRHILVPDLAAPPYEYYDEDGTQVYNALMSLGAMEHFVLEAELLDDTPLAHFTAVERELVLPGNPVTLIDTSVVTAPEVANNTLIYGELVGPFTVCGPGVEVTAIEIDVVFPRGLYYGENDGTLSDMSITWLFEARQIDDYGNALGGWTLLGLESRTDNQNVVLRQTNRYTVASGRWQVRGRRETVRDDDSRAGHDIEWLGMRGFTTLPPPSQPGVALYAIRAKADNQLSGNNRQRFTVIVRRMLPTWDPIGGWSAPVETRSIAWAAADVIKNTVYGMGLTDANIDLATLYQLSVTWAARGDEFNAVFDNRTTAWAALRSILAAGRAVPVRRGNVITFVRDQPNPAGEFDYLFNMRNIGRRSFTVDYRTVQEGDPDAVEVEYYNGDTWTPDYVLLPVPGTVGEPVRPERVKLFGVTNLKQAQRECAFLAAVKAYRNVFAQFTTEMDANLPGYGAIVALSHDVPGWAVGGEIASYDGASAVASVELTWTEGVAHYVLLSDTQGDVRGPYQVTPGTESNSFEFVDVPADGIISTTTDRDRTRFTFGPGAEYAKLMRIESIRPTSREQAEIQLVISDQRVHDAEIPYLGTGGSGTGGGTRIARYAPDDVPDYDSATEEQRNTYGFYAEDDNTVGTANDPGYNYAD